MDNSSDNATTVAAHDSNVTNVEDGTNISEAAYISRILPSVVAMLILFVLSAIGNVTVFLALVTSRSRKTRISVIILHLTVADLFVTFILIPTEISWRLLRFWFAGVVACKVFAYMRAFAFHLSSMVLIVVSLDRYIAIIYPLRANSEFARRGHFMLMAAWVVSAMCSLPQALVWDVLPLPTNGELFQCVTFGSDPKAVKGFTIFFLITVYFIPLLVMIVTYSRILRAISMQSDFSRQNSRYPSSRGDGDAAAASTCSATAACAVSAVTTNTNGHASAFDSSVRSFHRGRRSVASSLRFRPDRRSLAFAPSVVSETVHNGNGAASAAMASPPRNGSVADAAQQLHASDFRLNHFNRAKARTLRMTVLIVLAFILCWTPNVVMSLWFTLDAESAMRLVEPRLADVLFILTITNSVVNPYVYGSYASEMRTKCLTWFWPDLMRRRQQQQVQQQHLMLRQQRRRPVADAVSLGHCATASVPNCGVAVVAPVARRSESLRVNRHAISTRQRARTLQVRNITYFDSASDGCSSRSAERTNLRMATTTFCNSTVINNANSNSCGYSTSGDGGGGWSARNHSVSYSSQSSTSSSSTEKARKVRGGCGRLGLLGRVCSRPWSASAASTLCSGLSAAAAVKDIPVGSSNVTTRRIPRSRSAHLLTPPHERDEQRLLQPKPGHLSGAGSRSRKRVNVIENPRESSPMPPWARKASSRSRHFQKFLRLKRSRSMSELKIAL